MKKAPNKVSTEDLLKALDETSNEKLAVQEVFDFRNDVPLFLSKYTIEPGEHKVSKNILYRLYYGFSEFPVNRTIFQLSLNEFIPRDRHNFLINKNQIEIRLAIQSMPRGKSKYTPSSPSTRKHFELFMKECNIKEGKTWVQATTLAFIYHKWCRANRVLIRFKLRNFSSMIKVYLPTKRTTQYDSWIKVDEICLSTLTPADIRKLKNESEKRSKAHKESKEKGQSIRSVESSTESKDEI